MFLSITAFKNVGSIRISFRFSNDFSHRFVWRNFVLNDSIHIGAINQVCTRSVHVAYLKIKYNSRRKWSVRNSPFQGGGRESFALAQPGNSNVHTYHVLKTISPQNFSR